ncbi:MAG: NAD(+)/NADH kinase [Treponema sp.]|nr:NAD(+)/NADH kinase [Treponema sp.]
MKCLIVVNSFKKLASGLGKDISLFLKKNDIICSEFIYDGNSIKNDDISVSFAGYDFVITLGGDGTVLFVCRSCAPLGIPVFAINLGEFGFLACVQVHEWKQKLQDYIDGQSCVSERFLIQAEVMRNGKSVFVTSGMNDIVISSTASSRLINLNVAYKWASLGAFKANGLIISSSTGSTGYSAAAGGPIVEPSLAAMILTPISSFSLSARPLVFGSDGELAITILPSRVNVGLSADCQIDFSLQTKDTVILKVPEYKANLICSAQEKFYSALQSKLNWSGGPRA